MPEALVLSDFICLRYRKHTLVKAMVMKHLFIILLVMAICCSACSYQKSAVSQNASEISLSSPDILNGNDSAESSSENNYDGSSYTTQEDMSIESDTTNTQQYQGFTQEQWNILQDQKEQYGHLSEQERANADFNGEIECYEFNHLRWEHFIANPLIEHVGVDEFESWLKEIDSINNADQCNIYSFSLYFSIQLDELVSLIETNGLTEIYDLETIKRRYTYFSDNE